MTTMSFPFRFGHYYPHGVTTQLSNYAFRSKLGRFLRDNDWLHVPVFGNWAITYPMPISGDDFLAIRAKLRETIKGSEAVVDQGRIYFSDETTWFASEVNGSFYAKDWRTYGAIKSALPGPPRGYDLIDDWWDMKPLLSSYTELTSGVCFLADGSRSLLDMTANLFARASDDMYRGSEEDILRFAFRKGRPLCFDGGDFRRRL